ncbi:Processing alpha glucosidase I [Dimargaris verticillata]|uniref:Mannosyl-oligosaccharide glucosidase n=1 Tax=Dimargaris verticillata TaxID=2761393 RepID=A0A9W8AZN7_9FUNG|nr:Processing alpha glucosidase I [Dimargaris verticillata]
MESLRQELDQSLQWGTYRPNLYVGMRPRLPHSLLTGLMWYGLNDLESFNNIRHTCEMGDGMRGYGYTQHDGRNYAHQVVNDARNRLVLASDFIKTADGAGWQLRVTGTAMPNSDRKTDSSDTPTAIALVYYVGLDGLGTLSGPSNQQSTFALDEAIVWAGDTPDLGAFSLTIHSNADNQPAPQRDTQSTEALPSDRADTQQAPMVGLKVPSERLWEAKSLYQGQLLKSAKSRILPDGRTTLAPASIFQVRGSVANEANIYMVQYSLQVPFELTIEFAPHGFTPPPLTTLPYRIRVAQLAFDQRFEVTFGLQARNISLLHTQVAQAALSNLVGGIGYFYGNQMVATSGYEDGGQDGDGGGPGHGWDESQPEFAPPDPTQYEFTKPFALFSSTPSRSFFPRGFLWDEGFHQLLLGAWDNDLSLEILASWANLIDENGWVGREQILGDEARSKVPPEFQVQYPSYANPPTLHFALSAYTRRLVARYQAKDVAANLGPDFLNPALKVTLETESFPHSRYVDDPALTQAYLARIYPALRRQYHWFRDTQWGQLKQWGRTPPATEAYRWRGRTLNHTLTSGLDDYPRAVPHVGELHVDLMAWMGYMTRSMASISELVGEMGDLAEYQQIYDDILVNLDALHWVDDRQMYCDLTVDDDEESVPVCHKGYVTLFPLLLGLVPPSSPKLNALLELMHDPQHLWSPFGLRSLSKADQYFNTGEVYWRGSIWLNINYLALAALHQHYISVPGPYQAKAQLIYRELRDNLISTVVKGYQDTGFFWEQYSLEDGQGRRAHPFTGWSSLIALIIAEKYP